MKPPILQNFIMTAMQPYILQGIDQETALLSAHPNPREP